MLIFEKQKIIMFNKKIKREKIFVTLFVLTLCALIVVVGTFLKKDDLKRKKSRKLYREMLLEKLVEKRKIYHAGRKKEEIFEHEEVEPDLFAENRRRKVPNESSGKQSPNKYYDKNK